MIEDGVLELLQITAGLNPEFLRQCLAGLREDSQGVGLPARSIEGQHELAPYPFIERMTGSQRIELTNKSLVTAENQIGVYPIESGREPQALPAGQLGRQGGFVPQFG